MTSKRWLSLFLVMAAACGDDVRAPIDVPAPPPVEPPPPPVEPPPTPARGQLRLVHAAPVADRLDFYVQGETAPIASALAYGTVSATIQLAPGERILEARSAGAAATDPALYTSTPISVVANQRTTAVAAGLLGSTSEATLFRITALADAFGATAPGKARIRVNHSSYSLQSVALDIGDDGVLEVNSLERFATTEPAGLEVAAGGDALLAVLSTDTARTRQGAFVVPGALLTEGAEIHAVITGLSSARPRDPRGLVVTLVVTNRSDAAAVTVRQNPAVYLLAASPDAAALDAYGGPAKLFDNVAFGRLALRRLTPTAAGHLLDIRPAGADPGSTPLATLSTGPLVAGEQYLAVVHGLVVPSVPGDSLKMHVYRDELPLALDGNGRIRNVHAALGVGAIDVGRYTAGADPTYIEIPGFAAIAPGGASAAVGAVVLDGANPVPVNPGVRDAAQPTSVPLRFLTGSLTNTDRFFGVFAGAWTPMGTQLPPRYIVVRTGATSWTTATQSPQPPAAPPALDAASRGR